MTRAHYEAYEDNAGGWRWRLCAGSRTIADSGEGYTRKVDVGRAIAAHRRNAATTEVRWPHGIQPPKLAWWRRWGRAR